MNILIHIFKLSFYKGKGWANIHPHERCLRVPVSLHPFQVLSVRFLFANLTGKTWCKFDNLIIQKRPHLKRRYNYMPWQGHGEIPKICVREKCDQAFLRETTQNKRPGLCRKRLTAPKPLNPGVVRCFLVPVISYPRELSGFLDGSIFGHLTSI